MDYQLIAFLICFPVGLLAFSFGQWTKESPSEKEMFDRLVAARSARRVRIITKAGLEDEIATASEQMVPPRS